MAAEPLPIPHSRGHTQTLLALPHLLLLLLKATLVLPLIPPQRRRRCGKRNRGGCPLSSGSPSQPHAWRGSTTLPQSPGCPRPAAPPVPVSADGP